MGIKNPKRNVMQVTFIFNLFLAPLGIVILVIGLFVKSNLDPFQEFLKGDLHALSMCLVITGVLAIFVAIFGCYGVLRDRFFIVLMYPHLLLTIFAFQTVVAGLGFAQKISEGDVLYKKLNNGVQNYTGNAEVINYMQTELKCCGYNNSFDYTFPDIPDSCCSISSCSKISKYYERGCKGPFENFAELQGNIVFGVSSCFAVIELFGFMVFLYSCNKLKRSTSRFSPTRNLLQDESSDEEMTVYP